MRAGPPRPFAPDPERYLRYLARLAAEVFPQIGLPPACAAGPPRLVEAVLQTPTAFRAQADGLPHWLTDHRAATAFWLLAGFEDFLGDLAGTAVARLLTRGAGAAAFAGRLFSDAERLRLAETYAECVGTANLLGRARVRLRAAEAVRRHADQDVFTAAPKLLRYSDEPTDFSRFDEADRSGAGAPDRLKPLAPEAAVAYFRSLVPELGTDPKHFGDQMRRQSFTLAAATDKTLLGKVQGLIADRLATGRGVSSAPAEVEALLADAGVTAAKGYGEMVVRTNMMEAYTAGAVTEMQEPAVAEVFPVWRYVGIDDGRQRPRHGALFDSYHPNAVAFAEVRGTDAADVCNCRCVPVPVDKWEAARLQAGGLLPADLFSEEGWRSFCGGKGSRRPGPCPQNRPHVVARAHATAAQAAAETMKARLEKAQGKHATAYDAHAVAPTVRTATRLAKAQAAVATHRGNHAAAQVLAQELHNKATALEGVHGPSYTPRPPRSGTRPPPAPAPTPPAPSLLPTPTPTPTPAPTPAAPRPTLGGRLRNLFRGKPAAVPAAPAPPPTPAAPGPVPPLPPVRESRATVTAGSYGTPSAADRAAVEAAAKKIFGPQGTPQHFATLVGAPDNARVRVSAYPGGRNVTVSLDSPQIDRATRDIVINPDGSKYIHNAYFRVKAAARNSGDGVGLKMFSAQVVAAKAAGFSYIDTHAAGNKNSPDFNGYYTWPRFGYDQPLSGSFGRNDQGKDAGQAAQRAFPQAHTLLDVMATQEGRDWWKQHGADVHSAKFDLKDGSRSLRVMAEYIEERRQRTAGASARAHAEAVPGPAGGRADAEECDLSAADEAAIEAVWQRIESQGGFGD